MKMPSSNHKTSATQVNFKALRGRGRDMLLIPDRSLRCMTGLVCGFRRANRK